MRNALPLIAVLLLSAALRLWGIAFGLPHTEARPDESTVIYIALRALLFDFHPASLVYPTGYTYLLSGIYAVYGFLSQYFSSGAGPQSLLLEYACSPSALFLINRLLAAAFGVATVYVVYKTALEWLGRRAGVAAGFFMACCYLHVRDSHFGTLDVPMVFFIAASVLFIARWRNAPTVFNYACAGLLAGFATGTKYAGILLAAHGLASHLALAASRQEMPRLLKDRQLWLFQLALLAGFFISTPHAFLDFRQLAADFSYHKNLHGVMHGSNLWHHIAFSLNYGLGLPLLLAGFAGMVWCALKKWREFLAIFPFAAIYFAAADKVSSGYVRYAIPLLPFFCLAAAMVYEELAVRIVWKPRLSRVSLLLLLCALPLYNSLRLDSLLSRPDTRNEAALAAEKLLPDGATVGMLCGLYGCPLLPWDGGFYAARGAQALKQENAFKAGLYSALDSCRAVAGGPRYSKADYDAPTGCFYSLSGKPMRPEWIVVSASGLKNIDALPPGAGTLLREYEPVFSIEGGGRSPHALYDQEDAFYLPYSGFTGVSAPGPDLNFLHLRRPQR